ncbi:MAG: hypothetical protein ABWY71_03240 [Candidatus Saccharimonadales bacterium]
MKIKNTAGFSAVEGLVILGVVVLIGLAGWFIVSSKHKDKTPAPNTTSSTNDDSANTTTGDTKYLEIKEWGVKFALTTDTADAYYDTSKTTPLDAMSLRSHSLDSESDCTTAPQSVAAIFRVAKDAPDESLPGKKYSETQDGKTIGDYFYFIQGSQYNCTDNVEKQVVLQGVRNSFNTAGPTIQKK